jgi:hypothetical protein
MEPGASYFGTLFDVAWGNSPALLVALLILVIFARAIFWPGTAGGVTPPSLRDPIPFVFNTIQFVFNNDKFMKRVTYVTTLSRSYNGYIVHLRSNKTH